MDRKKTIVAAVMINAGILTVLFIAAMTMREEPVQGTDIGTVDLRPTDPKPLFKEIVELPNPAPLAVEVPTNQSVAFSLPPVALVEQKTTLIGAAETSPPPHTLVSPQVAVTTPVPNAALPLSLSESEVEVQKGDSLEKLAKKYRTSVDEIIKLNQLPSSFLRAGQRLRIPAEKNQEVVKLKSSVITAAENTEYYTMKVGDNPWSIAMKHHIKVDELLKLNGLNEKTARKLKPGDRLRIK